ncbi:MAG: AMP-binding protein [Hyphomicrobiales bacterium]|nr:AMP-binding protein [Hyphomicrobiales bacterium]
MNPLPDHAAFEPARADKLPPARHPLAGYSLASLLEGAAQLRPAVMALTGEAGHDGLTFAALQFKVEAWAGRLHAAGLNHGDTAALVAPASGAAIVALLACCRLGLNVVLLPLAMARTTRMEMTGALGAQAILTPDHAAGVDLADEALASVLANDTVRVIAMTGGEAPDGAIALDDAALGDARATLPREPRGTDMARIITFEVTPQGRAMPVVQEQASLIAAAMALVAAAKLGPGQRLVTALPPATQAGLAAGPVAMLLCGMSLHYMPEFSSNALARTLVQQPPATLLLPMTVTAALCAEASGGWHALIAMSRWTADGSSYTPPHALEQAAPLYDLHAFGERAMLCLPRDAMGRATALPAKPQAIAVNGSSFTAIAIEETPSGALLLSGAAVSGQHLPTRASA